jgi:lipopolysaccharide export LptBFGC system permease protein LptF
MMRVDFKNLQALRKNQELSNAVPYYLCSLDDLVGGARKSRDEAKFLTNELMRQRLAGRLEPGEKAPDKRHREDYRFEIQRRLALSSTYFVFLLLGASTGLWLRRGSQLGAMATAIGFALLYYILSMQLGTELAEVRLIPQAVAAWATNGLFLVAGLLMARRFMWR